MKITQKDVKYIANLSRLSMSDEEIETLGSQLNAIIQYVEQLNTLDCSDIEPTSHAIPLNNVVRDDLLTTSLSPKDAMKNAPDHKEKFYRVPKIIE